MGFSAEEKLVMRNGTAIQHAREARAIGRAIAKDCDSRLRPLLKAAEDLAAYFPTVLPGDGVLPNKKIIALREAIARAKA